MLNGHNPKYATPTFTFTHMANLLKNPLINYDSRVILIRKTPILQVKSRNLRAQNVL